MAPPVTINVGFPERTLLAAALIESLVTASIAAVCCHRVKLPWF